jgi:RND superfamily putative drug exporter
MVAAATWRAAPPWNEVARDQEFAFLPAHAPSVRGEALFRKAFPDDRLTSNMVLVLYRDQAGPGLLEQDKKFIEDVLEPRLRGIADSLGGLANEAPSSEEPLFGDEASEPATPKKRSIISHIHTPNAPGTGALLVSPDGKALLVVLELNTEFLSEENWPVIDRVEKLASTLREPGKMPAGLDVAFTGSAVLGRDHSVAELQSVRATGWLTVVLVISLLLLIYRAPLLALIPLAVVYLSVRVALNLLAILAGHGYLTLFQGLQIYITILAYGAGVDYCLFLTARFRETLEKGAVSACDAMTRAVEGVGAALVASAATVICGIAMLAFAEFGKFRQAGIAIPLSLFLVLCATLTFGPPLLCLTGHWAIWPQRLRDRTPSGNGEPPAPGLVQRGWQRLEQLLLRRPGAILLTSAAVMAPFAVAAGVLHNHLSFDMVGNLPPDAPSIAGTRILRGHMPAGVMGPVTVLMVDPHINFASLAGRDYVGRLTERLRDEKEELGLADIRSLTAPLGITPAAQHAGADLEVPEEARREALERAAVDRYVTDLGERAKIGTRLDLVLQESPFAPRSLDSLDRLERAVRDALPVAASGEAQIHFVGPTASARDLRSVVQRDRLRIQLLVLGCVFAVLVMLLGQVLVSIYLLLSVLFSYFTTLGVVFAVFWALDPHGFTGIDWKVAIFLFTILVAVGEDYNIFLMARITEEQRRFGPVRGIVEALTRTGPIISSCGIIMAGTFASLLAGSLTEMKQLGFALAFGILLDTFVVRPVLVPSFLILLHSGWLVPAEWRRARVESPAQLQSTDRG